MNYGRTLLLIALLIPQAGLAYESALSTETYPTEEYAHMALAAPAPETFFATSESLYSPAGDQTFTEETPLPVPSPYGNAVRLSILIGIALFLAIAIVLIMRTLSDSLEVYEELNWQRQMKHH